MLTASAAWVAGALSLLLSGAGGCYLRLEKPVFAPGLTFWLFLWMLHYVLLGLALGLVIGHCGVCRRSLIRRGVIGWSLYLVCSLCWVPLFFGAGWQITSLLLIAVTVCFGLCAFIPFAARSLLSALLLAICIWWQIYCFLQTLLIILWN